MRKLHKYYFTECSYNMILGRYMFMILGIDIKFKKRIIEGIYLPYKGCTSPMVGLNYYNYKLLNQTENITINLFVGSYVEEVFKSENN